MTILIPSGLKDNMDSEVRNPTAELFVSWDDTLVSGEWFRLDQAFLDDGSLLTCKSYLEDEDIVELITDIDAKLYDDESAFISMIEGYSELIGDSYHYAVSDLDFELINTNNRFTPRANKNLLQNSGFEEKKSKWNEILASGAYSSINDVNFHNGIRSYELHNPIQSNSYIMSNLMEVDYEKNNSYVFSEYLMGSGLVSLQLRAYDSTVSGINDIASGLIDYSVLQTPLASGTWDRYSISMNIPSNTSYLRAIIGISGEWVLADDGQVEAGSIPSIYDDKFIGDLILPKKSVKANIGFKGNNIRKFAGSISNIKPNLKNDIVTAYCYDWVNVLKDKKIVSTYYENLRTDQIIANLASLAGIDASKLNLEVGELTIEFAWLQEGSIWTYINQVSEAEGGIVFFDAEGVLNFYNRTHFDTYPDPIYGFTFDKNITNLEFEISKSKVKNRIEVKANPKKKLVSKTIYDLVDSQQIDPGETVEVWGQFNYGTETTVPALNVQVPAVGTDILANSSSDGSGSDESSNISIISYSIFQESIKVNIRNNSASSIYITKFTITGDPIVTKTRIEVIKEDSNSISLYDTQILTIENDLMDDESYAEILASKKLSEMKDPLDTVSIEIIGVPFLKVGDIVSVQRSYSGKSDNFQIIKNKWQFSDDLMQTLTLQKKVGISDAIYIESGIGRMMIESTFIIK